MSFALVCVLLLCSALPVFASTEEECADFSSTFHRHSYDNGIVDGGIYSLRNVSSGWYLDVDNAWTASGTNVSTYTYHGGSNQRFQFLYLGKGLYEIKPVYVDLRLHISGDNAVVQTKNRSTAQRFKLQLVGSRTAVILSESSGYTKALGISGANAQQVTYSRLSNKSTAQWVLEYADTGPASVYETFHIRNVNRNLYLDVYNESTAVGATVHGYLGLAQANQEWKMVPHPSGGYSLKPVIRSDMALSYIGTYLTIQNDNSNTAQQQFYIYEAGTEASTGRKLYRIGLPTAEGTKYLTLKTQPSYATVHYYVEWTLDATDLWAFEAVVSDAKDPRPLTLNTSLSGSVASSYNELVYYTYKPQITSRHKIEFEGSLCFPETPISAKGSGLQRRYTYNGLDVFDVLLEAGVVYYIPIRFASAAGGSYGAFSLRVRQLTFTGHSAYHESYDIDQGVSSLRALVEGINFHFTQRSNASAEMAQSATNSLTGLRDFNSEIFLYFGHGSPGYACYDGTEWFDARDLPDMSNCELAIWGACKSDVQGPNLAALHSETLDRDAKTIITWGDNINVYHIQSYVQKLLVGITSGKSVYAASQYALATGDFASTEAIATSIHLAGINLYHVIFPHPATNMATSAIGSIDTTNASIQQVWNRSEYELVVENASIGVKLYSRMVNGIASDDYFVEFYDQNGNLTEIQKSEHTMQDSDIAVATEQLNQYAAMNRTAVDSTNGQIVKTQILYVDGAWVLAEEHRVDGKCSCCYETVFCNALTGEVIEE